MNIKFLYKNSILFLYSTISFFGGLSFFSIFSFFFQIFFSFFVSNNGEGVWQKKTKTEEGGNTRVLGSFRKCEGKINKLAPPLILSLFPFLLPRMVIEGTCEKRGVSGNRNAPIVGGRREGKWKEREEGGNREKKIEI